MRRICVVLALVAATACQGDDSYRSKPEEQTITSIKADVLARAAVLKPQDLPGYKRTATDTEVTPFDPDECFRNPTPYVATRYAGFEKGNVAIATGADIAPNLDRLRSDFALWTGDELLPCLKRVMTRDAYEEGAELARFASRQFSVPIRGAEGTFGMSLRVTYRGPGGQAALHMVLLAAAVDHAELTVSAFGFQEDAPSTSYLTKLLAKSVNRVRATLA